MGIHICSDSALSQSDIDAVARIAKDLGFDVYKDQSNSLCVKVRQYRTSHGMKLQELADQAGLLREDIWNIESGVIKEASDIRVKKLLTIIEKEV